MGYYQNIIVSSLLDQTTRERAIQSACSHWPFLRHPRQDNAFSDRLLLAMPELTQYLFDFEDNTVYEAALEQSESVESELPSWSQEFPDASFTYIRADCFGGTCLYDGFVCQANVIIAHVDPSKDGHIRLLEHVGITTDGIFDPFKRAFFDGYCSGPHMIG